ncbi:hypothetical protein AHF37_01205 [Paragonimus kellicotti]|nr:hypothetical protein AHF37_01205 [Paragonimus kellicotti]
MQEIQLRGSCPELCEKNKSGFLRDESITYTTGSPITEGSRLGDDAYFTICPGAWDGTGMMRDKRLAVLDREIYRTLSSSTAGNLGHTYLIEVSPKGLEPTYSILKNKPSTSKECARTDYQSLVPTLRSPKLVCTLEDPLASTPASASDDADWTHNEHISQTGQPHVSLPVDIRMPRAYCQTCDRSNLKTFTPNNLNSNDVCSHNPNCTYIVQPDY